MVLDKEELNRIWPYLTDSEKNEIFQHFMSVEDELLSKSLRYFIKQAWHVLEPDISYIHNWHVDAMADHLEAVTKGQIQKLIINIPPGAMKSLSVCVFWPAWEWILSPHIRWMFASYSSDLSVRDSIKTRDLIQSSWYKSKFSNSYSLKKTNEDRLTNSKQGFRIATSVGGVGTGERVHRVVNDDLVRSNDAFSTAKKGQAIAHMQAMSTRAVSSDTFSQVLIMQRISQDDPAGWAIEQGGWEILMLPMEFESKRRSITCLGFQDPRQEDGELLCRERWDEVKIAEMKLALGTYKAAAELQQRPSPEDGGLIKRESLKFYTLLPQLSMIIQSWDTAFKTGALNDYSVCTTWGIGINGCYYLLDRYKAKVQFPDLKKQVVSLYKRDKPGKVLVEDKASGQSLIQEMKNPMEDPDNAAVKHRLPVKEIDVDSDKVTRLAACSAVIESNVFLPQSAPWLDDYIENMLVFPNGAHDDDVDSTTLALNYLNSIKTFKPYGATVDWGQR